MSNADNIKTNSARSDNGVPPDDAAWSFRGYRLRPSEFNTAMVHFYRGEVQRANTWRNRLDTTTNWAVVAAGAAISFALSDPSHHYGVIVLNTVLTTIFLWIEARRYRYYELWSYRIRLMETDFFAAMLVPPFAPSAEWAESLAESLLQPSFPISMWEAIGRRFRRNYVWIFLILAAAWMLKNYLHPTPATTLGEFVSRGAIGPFSGELVLTVGLLYNGVLFLLGLLTAALHQASGEVLPKWGDFPLLNTMFGMKHSHELVKDSTSQVRQTIQRLRRKRQQLLALVISVKSKEIADRVLKEMRRGVTELHGRGMYAQQEREVLMIAVTVTEMQHLKALVKAEDPNAFVIVTPAQEVLGSGFQPLEN